MKSSSHYILADGRWRGQHGIGRFSTEVLSRLKNVDILSQGPAPLSLKNLFWQSRLLSRQQAHRVYFTPGFNPVLRSDIPFVLTIHDLIHLHFPGKMKWLKQFFYTIFIKSSAKNAAKIVTVSNYSKQCILDWTGLPDEKVVVAGNGISPHFMSQGTRHAPGFAYLLHVGNTKEHKNMGRLIQAFAKADIDKEIKLLCTGQLSRELIHLITAHQLEGRVLSQPNLSEAVLSDYYRGALGVVFPSLHEGFGLPIVEGMASGIPVLTSTTTSMPEVAGNAAVLVDPYDVDALSSGITRLVNDADLRGRLIEAGLRQAKQFSWEKTAQTVQDVLDEFRVIV